MPRQTKDHGGINSDEWCSGPKITKRLSEFFRGPVMCDPCSNKRSIVEALHAYTWGGLIRPWMETTYANWPYSKNEVWSGKAIYEMRVRHVSELVILCMTATSTQWWQGLMYKPKRNPRVLCIKREKFLGPGGQPVDSSRFEPALIYYGKEVKRFDKIFAPLVMWSSWGR